MIKRLLLLLAVFLPLLAFSVSADGQVSAYDPFKDVQCEGKASESAVCNTSGESDPIAGSNGLLAKITNIVAFVAGIAAIIIIIVGSIRYITSGGDAGNVKKAKDTVFHALVGIAVIVLARTLILFVLSKL